MVAKNRHKAQALCFWEEQIVVNAVAWVSISVRDGIVAKARPEVRIREASLCKASEQAITVARVGTALDCDLHPLEVHACVEEVEASVVPHVVVVKDVLVAVLALVPRVLVPVILQLRVQIEA